jgi:hypothetical protein
MKELIGLFKFHILFKIFKCMDILRGWIKHYAMISKYRILERLHVIFEIKGVQGKEKRGFGDLQKEREKNVLWQL